MTDPQGRIVNLFAGSNTAAGFHSFYHHLAGPEAARVFIIKGGPGIGKSTLMRRIGESFREEGWNVELFSCSSDTSSVDGMAIPALGAAILDGTAPHVVEPTDPGAVGEVVNLGEFWDRDQISGQRTAIRSVNDRLSRLYRMAHDCLSAASRFRNVLADLNQRGGTVNTAKLRAMGIRLAQEISSLPRVQGPPWLGTWRSGTRHLFASAVTNEGMVNYLDSITGDLDRRHVIIGPAGSGKSVLMNSVMQAGLLLGLGMVVFHCSLDPDRVEHLVFPQQQAAIVTSSWPHLAANLPGDQTTDTRPYISPGLLTSVSHLKKQFERRIEESLDASVGFLAEAKELHDLLESYYIPAVDFSGVDETGQRIRQEILNLAQLQECKERS